MKTTIVLLILFSTIRNPKSTFASRLPMKPARKKTKSFDASRDRRQRGVDLKSNARYFRRLLRVSERPCGEKEKHE
jgi:hypothetical protein